MIPYELHLTDGTVIFCESDLDSASEVRKAVCLAMEKSIAAFTCEDRSFGVIHKTNVLYALVPSPQAYDDRAAAS